MTFGQTILEARRAAGLSQKELAGRVKKDDGTSISASYLNDIEHDRRSPTSEQLIKELAAVLGLAPEVLYFAAGRIPSEIIRGGAGEKQAVSAFDAFRKALRRK